MELKQRILAVVLGVILVGGLSGCDTEITGATPDPGVVINAAPGDILKFEVTGPEDGQLVFHRGGENSNPGLVSLRYKWGICYKDALCLCCRGYNDAYVESNGHGACPGIQQVGKKSFTYTVPTGLPYNKIWITCLYGCANEGYSIKTWTIRLGQGTSTTWIGTYYLEDQDDLNALKDYTTITGDLVLRGTALTSLIGLEKLKIIGGSLIINGTLLQNLQGLENLTSTGIEISGNEQLASISSLSGLSSLSSLKINGNSSLAGLENLQTIGETLFIGNASLQNLKGLDNLNSLGGINMSFNEQLTSFSNLSGITSLGSLILYHNTALTELGFNALKRVEGDFEITFNTNLCLTLVEALRDQVVAVDGIGGSVDMGGNKDCTSP